jgi:hypothetical protein
MTEGLSLDYKDVEDILKCPLCMEVCDDSWTIPCHHSYCTPCLKKLIEKSDGRKQFPCPACRTMINIPQGGAKDFPPAFIINRLGEAVRRKKGVPLQHKPKCSVRTFLFICSLNECLKFCLIYFSISQR